MKTISIITAAFILMVLAAPAEASTYHNAKSVDAKLSITKRLNDGTLLPAVRKIQTQMINGKLYTNEPAVGRNMSHLRRLSDCSVRPQECKKGNAWEL